MNGIYESLTFSQLQSKRTGLHRLLNDIYKRFNNYRKAILVRIGEFKRSSTSSELFCFAI